MGILRKATDQILDKLIEQSRMPSGFLGKTMLSIMNRAHNGMTIWGISQLKSGERVLDVSCGGGNAIGLMAAKKLYNTVYGIDYSADAVAMAKKYNKALVEAGTVIIEQASVLNLPYEDSYFDAVTTFQSHYHWPDIEDAMREVHRVLKPGGVFVLVSEIYKIQYHMNVYNTEELTKKLFLKSGFKNVNLMKQPGCICVIGGK
jgi:ubiquinone/menaquinone biosynthesis C-methylase UbiE